MKFNCFVIGMLLSLASYGLHLRLKDGPPLDNSGLKVSAYPELGLNYDYPVYYWTMPDYPRKAICTCPALPPCTLEQIYRDGGPPYSCDFMKTPPMGGIEQ